MLSQLVCIWMTRRLDCSAGFREVVRDPRSRALVSAAFGSSPRSCCCTAGPLPRWVAGRLGQPVDDERRRGSNIVDVYVGYLRRKLGAAHITTVRGMGYRLEAVAPTEPSGDPH